MDDSLKKTTFKNLIYSFSAQIISILLSTLLSLVLPKILGVEDFSYWQLFLFYINYVGFFHFGITDGMYLKTGGKEYCNLDKKELSSQFYVLLFFQLFLFFILLLVCFLFFYSGIRFIILIFTGLYMIVANLNWFLGYIFQATNRVKIYSISVMIDKIIFLVFLIFSFICNIDSIFIFILFYIFSTFCALLFSISNSIDILKSKPYNLKKSFSLAFNSSKIGINLTLSSISSLLILGIGRFLVDRVWGIEVFGKFSFALSLTNFFLLFITQFSVVLFPSLRKINVSSVSKMFNIFNDYLDSILPLIYICYFPLKIILSLWLPQYKVSLEYLSLLLPICVFDGKNQMVNNTYFKVLRKEKKLLLINIITVILSFFLSVISIFVFDNIYLVILSMLISILFRCFLSEFLLCKDLNLKFNYVNCFSHICLSTLFLIISLCFSDFHSFILTFIIVIIYLLVTNGFIVYKKIFSIIKNINLSLKIK